MAPSTTRVFRVPAFRAAGDLHAAAARRGPARPRRRASSACRTTAARRTGPARAWAPREIRAQSSLIRSYSYFQKVAPFDRLNVADVGDVDAPPVSIEKCYEAVEARIGAIADAGARPIVVGGDHSISLPVLRALARRHGPLALVQFDAHIDTWDEYFGGKYFHGTPFRRAIEEGLIDGKRFIQVGIRGSDVRRGGLRVPPRARHHDDRHRSGEGPRHRVGRRAKSAAWRPVRRT